jgi:hypothetical protein
MTVIGGEERAFCSLRDPAIVIRRDSVTFNAACIGGLGALFIFT